MNRPYIRQIEIDNLEERDAIDRYLQGYQTMISLGTIGYCFSESSHPIVVTLSASREDLVIGLRAELVGFLIGFHDGMRHAQTYTS